MRAVQVSSTRHDAPLMAIRRIALWPVLIAALYLAVACDSGGESESAKAAPATQQAQAATAAPAATAPPEPTPTPAPVPTAMPEPTATPVPTATREPTPAPTATPIPTDTPTPTDAPEPAPATAPADDFDLERFTAEIVETPARTVRAVLHIDTPAGVSVNAEVAVRSEDETVRAFLEVSAGPIRRRIEIITAGGWTYLSDEAGGETPGWIKAQGAENPLQVFGDYVGPATLGRQWTAVAVEPCGGERMCFVLEDPEAPTVRLFVDTATYYPVIFTNSQTAVLAPTQIEFDWNSEVDIAIPAEAEEVSSDEMGVKMFEIVLTLGALQSG